jgi:glycosyltransferase involved in cell wall biosynthesis
MRSARRAETNSRHEAPDAGGNGRVRVLYSFPHKIGAARICNTAWQQVNGLVVAGAIVLACPGAVARALPEDVEIRPTLARGKVRIPYRVLGHRRALAVHDRIVAQRLPKLAERIDIVHTWPSGALNTLRAAKALGIPTVLERPNAHTRFAYDIVRQEEERLGVSLPKRNEHSYEQAALEYEEQEYQLADRLLCPSDFVVQTFREEGFSAEKLVRHAYGFDERVFHPGNRLRDGPPYTVLFVGDNGLRKGLHYALEAWRGSPLSREGRFLVAGELPLDYVRRIEPLLDHPRVELLGHRNDVPELCRSSDIFILPTVEEGSPLACLEALGSGCVPLVSEVCAGVCIHMTNSLVHPVGDVDALTGHLTMLHEDDRLLERLRAGALQSSREYTWSAAGERLLDVYRGVIDSLSRGLLEAGASGSRAPPEFATG